MYNIKDTGETVQTDCEVRKMKKICCFLVLAVLLCGCALAEREVPLPNSRYAVNVPDWMRFKADPAYPDIGAYVSEMLEMDFTSYPRGTGADGQEKPLKETAEALVSAGAEAELREINGIEMVCFRTTDPWPRLASSWWPLRSCRPFWDSSSPGLLFIF